MLERHEWRVLVISVVASIAVTTVFYRVTLFAWVGGNAGLHAAATLAAALHFALLARAGLRQRDAWHRRRIARTHLINAR